MKTLPRLLWPCLGLVLLATPLQAKRHHQAAPPAAGPLATPSAEPAPLPAEAAPKVSPDAPPSVSLQPFLDTHLGKILAPLGTAAFAQPEVIASLKASYADGLAAGPASHQPAYQLAQNVCDAITSAMTERVNAVAALRGALATRSSEAEQPRGGGQAVAAARDKDAFFTDSQKNTWIQRTAVLRDSINALDGRERAVERQLGAWYPPPPVAPAPVAAANPNPAAASAPGSSVSAPSSSASAPTPSVSAPPAANPVAPVAGQDPVVGSWLWSGNQPVDVLVSNTMDGSRHGNWHFVSNMSGGRYYEFHWKHKGWVDYVVLSADGKKLEGKSNDGKPVSAERR